MRNLVRAFAALNALFGVAVGLLCVLAPMRAADAFHVDPSPSIAIVALIRMLGGLLFLIAYCLMLYNVYMTITASEAAPEAQPALQPAE